MRDGLFFRFAIIAVVALLAASVAQPYATRILLSETAPRIVTARGNLSDAEQSIIALFEQVSPSVVQVVGRQSGRAMSDDESTGVQSGTGFVWDGAGNIVTNNHVVDGTTDVAVRLATGEAIAADIVGTAPNYDLAVVRLRDSRVVPKPIAIGSSADLKVGQFAFAIGNPFGLDQSLTFGVISALHRRLPTSSGHQISNVIQTDAAVNPVWIECRDRIRHSGRHRQPGCASTHPQRPCADTRDRHCRRKRAGRDTSRRGRYSDPAHASEFGGCARRIAWRRHAYQYVGRRDRVGE